MARCCSYVSDFSHHRHKAVVPKVCYADSKEFATSSQGIRGYVSVMAAWKFINS
jgi:hypothetical protein